jgi:hypothetical protein
VDCERLLVSPRQERYKLSRGTEVGQQKPAKPNFAHTRNAELSSWPLSPDKPSEDFFCFELIAGVASDELHVEFAGVLEVVIERDSFRIIRVEVGTGTDEKSSF